MSIKKFIRIFSASSFALILLTLNLTCSSVTAPEEIKPGRRDYVWTVDTLIIPFTKLYSMSGSNPDDVWAVGPGGDLNKTIYHFDGVKWFNDGISRNISPESVFAIAKNNVWIGGQNGKIWNYDGVAWKEVIRFERPRESDITFYCIWGDSPTNIFFAGYSGLPEDMTSQIARYNESKWELNEFPNLKYNFVRINKDVFTKKYYLLGLENKPDGGEIYGLFEYDGNKNIKQIFKSSNASDSSASFRKINNEIFFGIGTTINKYINGNFTPFLKVNEIDYWKAFYGRTEKDIFLVMAYGIAHYNGTDIKYLYKNPNKIWTVDAVLFEKEVFFLVVDPSIGGNLIIRGKLN